MADVLDPLPSFCTADELTTKLGQLGIDVQTLYGPPNGIDGALSQATDDIRFACAKWPFEALTQSRIVRNWCKVLAAYYVTGNGGEPHAESLKTEADRVFNYLDMILEGKITSIPDLPTIAGKEDKGGIPVISVIAVDPTCNTPVRVNRPASTGTPANYPVQPYYPTDYGPRRRFTG